MKKRLIIGVLVLLLVCIVTYAGVFRGLYSTSRKDVNRETAAILEAVHETYPDVPEEELIRILQDAGDGSAGAAFLEKYGYSGDVIYSNTMRRQIRRYALWSGAAAVFLTGLGALALYLYEYRRQRQVQELIRYTQDISRGVYDLRINENTEDALSQLSNALYKLTVLLKESAENSRKESEGLSRSLADISHQIKTPLTSIQIMLDNIEDNPEMDPETRQEFLRLISSQTDRISSLVVTLLQLARFDSGAVVMNPQETDVQQMISDVFEELSMLAEVKGVMLSQKTEPGVSWLLDRKWQHQALANIVKNAIEHSPAGTHVTAETERSSLFLKIRISDQGEGISREDQRHIFERFYKAKNSSADSIGIGLNFAKTVIEKEGGAISVESVPGEGTAFTIRYYRKPGTPDIQANQ